MSKTIPLTKGCEAIVDDADYEWLSRFSWRVQTSKKNNCRYAIRNGIRTRAGQRFILMHREIANPPQGLVVDHINGNGLDNRRSNLRVCSHSSNAANKSKQSSSTTSKFKGVTWNKGCRRWQSSITHNYKHYYLGLYDDEIDAARSYDLAALKYFSEFACLNFEKDRELYLSGNIEKPKRNYHHKPSSRKYSSRFRGVSWNKQKHRWRTYIWYDNRLHNLGYFNSEEAAALAYDKAARKYHGERARLNFP